MRGYTVYKHTSPSGKVYIGITKQKPEKRWQNGTGYKHSPHLLAAIDKYGWDTFQHEILAQDLTEQEATAMEIELIKRCRANEKEFGYNIENGGSCGPKHSEATRAKISEANRKRTQTAEAKQKLRAYRLTHPITPETAKKIGDANRGRKHRPETIEKMRNAQRMRMVKNLDTGEVYKSLMDAGRATGLSASHIMQVCQGKRNKTGGCRWAYADKEVIA